MLAEAVGHGVVQAAAGGCVGIDIDRSELAERAHVVDARHVVVVDVRDEQSVDLAEGLAKDLLAEVGSTVDQHARGLRLYERGGTQTLVPRVLAAADLAVAADDGHAVGRSRT